MQTIATPFAVYGLVGADALETFEIMTQVVYRLQRDRIEFSHWIDFLVFFFCLEDKRTLEHQMGECVLFIYFFFTFFLAHFESASCSMNEKFQCAIKNSCNTSLETEQWGKWGRAENWRNSHDSFENMLRCCNQF